MFSLVTNKIFNVYKAMNITSKKTKDVLGI